MEYKASLYPSSAAAWAQGTGSSFSVPFSRLNVNSLWVCEACFASDTHAVESLRVCEAYSIADTQIVKNEGITRKLYIPKRRIPGVCGAMSKMFVGGC